MVPDVVVAFGVVEVLGVAAEASLVGVVAEPDAAEAEPVGVVVPDVVVEPLVGVVAEPDVVFVPDAEQVPFGVVPVPDAALAQQYEQEHLHYALLLYVALQIVL